MKQPKQVDIAFATLGHPLYELNDSVQRLQEEHVLLEEGINDIHEIAKAVGWIEDEMHNYLPELRELTLKVKDFQREMDAHAKWEEEKMFPMIAWYFGEELNQFTLMEQEHEMAKQYVAAFLAAIAAVEPIDQPVYSTDARKIALFLCQAYAILVNLFSKEEEIITAMTDRSNAYGY
jgi:regulator of cell morphogenesis and NO signaling